METTTTTTRTTTTSSARIEELAELLITEVVGWEADEYFEGGGGPARARVVAAWARDGELPTPGELDRAWAKALEGLDILETRCAGSWGEHSIWACGPWVRRGEGRVDCTSCGVRS